MFDNLYSFNNTLFVVTSDPSSVPKPSLILSAGLPLSVDMYVCFPPVCRPYHVPRPQEGTRGQYTD